MPVYEYINERTGARVDLVRSVEERDQVPGHRRVQVPRRINFLAGTPDPTGPDCSVPKALRELEQTQSHGEIAREAGYSTEQLKKVWGM